MAQQELDNGLETFVYDPDEDFEVLDWQDEEPQRDAEGYVLEHEVYQDGADLVESREAMDALARAAVETQYYGTVPYDERLRADWAAGYRAGVPLVVRNIEKNILSDEKWRYLDSESLHRLADTYEQMLNPHDHQGYSLSVKEVMELQGDAIGEVRDAYTTHGDALHYLADVQAGVLVFNETVTEYTESQAIIAAAKAEVEDSFEEEAEPVLLADVSLSKGEELMSPNASLAEVKRRFEDFRRSEFQERRERGHLEPAEKARMAVLNNLQQKVKEEAAADQALDELRQRLRGSQSESHEVSQVEHEDEGMEL